MKNFNEINKRYLEIISLLEEGELTPELEAELQITRDDLRQSCEEISSLVLHTKYDNELIKGRIKQLNDKIVRNEQTIDFFENILLKAVNLFGQFRGKNKNKSIELDDLTLMSSESESVEIDPYKFKDADSKYKKFSLRDKLDHHGMQLVLENLDVSFDEIPDKTLIKEDLNKKIEIEGASIKKTQKVKIK